MTALVRVAVVGLGSAATRAHIPTLQALSERGAVQIAGVCDRDPAKRAQVQRMGVDAPGFGDNGEMLDAVAPDLLVIATPPSAHLDEIAAAVTRCVHVLCEKPLGLRDADVATLRSLTGRHPELAVATVHQYVYAQAWAWLARAAAGAVQSGEPFSLRVLVERPGTDPLAAGGWRTDIEHEGGILGDHAVHYLSLMRLVDPATLVLGCARSGEGGRETAIIELAVGDAGTAHIAVSYAGESRCNVIVLERPAQCLRVTWDGGSVIFDHNGRVSPPRAVGSLSERAYVNALDTPMYDSVVAGLSSPLWRERETRHTLDVAMSLSTALGYHRARGRAASAGARPAAGLR